MKYLHLTLRYDPSIQHPMHRHLTECDTAECSRLVAWNVSEDHIHSLFYIIADREPYVDSLDAVKTIEWYDITPVDEESFYVFVRDQRRKIDDQFFAAFYHPSLVVVAPLEFRAGGELRFNVLGEPQALQSMVKALPEPITVSIDTVSEYDQRPDHSGGSLTDRQHEALKAGVQTGYYDVPRTGSVENVARELDCAASTASNHLRKAESHLVRELIDR